MSHKEAYILKRLKKVLGILGIAVLAISVLWGTGTIPKGIGRYTATKYVEENCTGIDLEFENIEVSTAYGD